MSKGQQIIVINWFNHHDDVHLKEEYETLEKIFGDNEDKVHCLFDCDDFGVFEYADEVHEQLKGFENGLFDPEYYYSLQFFKDEYYEYEDQDPEQVSDDEFFADLQYQKQLCKIMSESGGDEREFDRLWTEQFVFGNEALAY